LQFESSPSGKPWLVSEEGVDEQGGKLHFNLTHTERLLGQHRRYALCIGRLFVLRGVCGWCGGVRGGGVSSDLAALGQDLKNKVTAISAVTYFHTTTDVNLVTVMVTSVGAVAVSVNGACPMELVMSTIAHHKNLITFIEYTKSPMGGFWVLQG